MTLAFLAFGDVGAAETIKVISYHTHPPFIVADKEGLTYDLATLLSERSGGRFVFQVVPTSRPRLNKLLEQKKTFIVPWVNPAWFKDKSETKHVWTRNSLMFDNNAIVSHIDKSVVYEGPMSISGMVFGGVRGHTYTGIDDYIQETGKIRRIDADNHISNIRKLLKGRIDVALMPGAAASFFVLQHEVKGRLFISPKPHSRYFRRVIISGGRNDLEKFIKDIVGELEVDPEWNSIKERYK